MFQTEEATMGQISLLCLALITTMMMKAVAAEEMECRPNPLENGFVEQTGLGVFTFKCKNREETSHWSSSIQILCSHWLKS